MTKFKYEFTSAEQTVITVNVIKSVTINGQLIPIGAHLVTFSGRAQLSFADLMQMRMTGKDGLPETYLGIQLMRTEREEFILISIVPSMDKNRHMVP